MGILHHVGNRIIDENDQNKIFLDFFGKIGFSVEEGSKCGPASKVHTGG